jgi:telomerase reverse transcriptase
MEQQNQARHHGSRAGDNSELGLKVPKRLRGRALELVRQLQKNNQNCPYTALLRYYCPIEVSLYQYFAAKVSERGSDKNQEIGPPGFANQSPRVQSSHCIPELKPPTSRSSPDIPYFETSNVQDGATANSAHFPRPENKAIAKQKPCLMDYATPTSSVSAFCRSSLQRLVPNGFWGIGEGGASNRRAVLKHVDKFVRMSRFESLSLHEVCKGLKVCLRDAPWNPWASPKERARKWH